MFFFNTVQTQAERNYVVINTCTYVSWDIVFLTVLILLVANKDKEKLCEMNLLLLSNHTATNPKLN